MILTISSGARSDFLASRVSHDQQGHVPRSKYDVSSESFGGGGFSYRDYFFLTGFSRGGVETRDFVGVVVNPAQTVSVP